MPNLKFNQLLILSNSEKLANAFQFQSHLNLIVATDNNVGKSTIVKLLFWTLGCEVAFDTKWTNLDCKTIVKFQVDDKFYSVMRYKNYISFKNGNDAPVTFNKVTGDFAQRFADIVNFQALLPDRDDNNLETPPPAYYFLPYYIDQKKSWVKPWDSFEGLQQYAEWKTPIIKYHVGLLTTRHFEIEIDKHQKKGVKKIITKDVEKIDIALSIVEKHVPKLSRAITTDVPKFSLMTDEIRQDLVKLANDQEIILDELSKTESEKTDFEHQKTIAERVVGELELDYQFSVENLENDDIECPLCGTIHQNTAVSRASILVDKQQAENQLEYINTSLVKLQKKLDKVYSGLSDIKVKINDLNSKYTTKEEGDFKGADLTTIIESIAGKSIQEKVFEGRKEKILEAANVEQDIKTLSQEQRDIQNKYLTDEIVSFFSETFSKYAKLLNTDDVNLSAINSPLDYNKVVKEGGAAENTRVTLAYNLAIYSVVEKYSNNIKSTFVLDTPNQHEQSDLNYGSIIKLILECFPNDAQVILCAMDNEHLLPYEKQANVIRLTMENKLWDKAKFEEVKAEFDSF